jgi:hypothetical protein
MHRSVLQVLHDLFFPYYNVPLIETADYLIFSWKFFFALVIFEFFGLPLIQRRIAYSTYTQKIHKIGSGIFVVLFLLVGFNFYQFAISNDYQLLNNIPVYPTPDEVLHNIWFFYCLTLAETLFHSALSANKQSVTSHLWTLAVLRHNATGQAIILFILMSLRKAFNLLPTFLSESASRYVKTLLNAISTLDWFIVLECWIHDYDYPPLWLCWMVVSSFFVSIPAALVPSWLGTTFILLYCAFIFGFNYVGSGNIAISALNSLSNQIVRYREPQNPPTQWIPQIEANQATPVQEPTDHSTQSSLKSSVESLINPSPEPQQSKFTCVVCLENPRTLMVEPCAHLCLCDSCAQAMQEKYEANPNATSYRTCPVCRTPTTGTRRVYQ